MKKMDIVCFIIAVLFLPIMISLACYSLGLYQGEKRERDKRTAHMPKEYLESLRKRTANIYDGYLRDDFDASKYQVEDLEIVSAKRLGPNTIEYGAYLGKEK